MKRITDLQIIQEFGNYGLYWCRFKNDPHLFTINNGVVKVLIHYADHDELEFVHDDVAEELLQEIELYKQKVNCY